MKLYQDKVWLEFQYNTEYLSQREIAERAECCYGTIQHWMRKFDIPRRDRKTACKLSCDKHAAVRKVAHKLSCDRRIANRSFSEPYQNLEWLKEKYLVEGLSPRKIAEQAGCSRSTIEYWLKVYEIPRRSRSDASKLLWEHGIFGSESWRAAQSEVQTEAWRDEGRREAQAERTRKQHIASVYKDVYTDEVRSKMSTGLKAAHERGCYDGCCTEETRCKLSFAHIGPKHWNWQGGKSFEPYPASFNGDFKRRIMERDSHTCAVCRLSAEVVHHINYVKDDTVPENCIALCRHCHGKTNKDREYWQMILSSLLEARARVFEIVI